MGVWIETHRQGLQQAPTICHTLRGCVDWNLSYANYWPHPLRSHPSWVCGLKLISSSWLLKSFMSHPSWVCGLKPELDSIGMQQTLSHPSWVCGLKLKIWYLIQKRKKVTPFVGVWIETDVYILTRLSDMSHPSWVCGLKQRMAESTVVSISHTLRGCVDWNYSYLDLSHLRSRHTLRGCVDWNLTSYTRSLVICCHTLRGCVDWNHW